MLVSGILAAIVVLSLSHTSESTRPPRKLCNEGCRPLVRKDVVRQVTYPDGVTFPVFKPRKPTRPSARPRSGYESSGGKSRVREVAADLKNTDIDDEDSDNEQDVQLAIAVGPLNA